MKYIALLLQLIRTFSSKNGGKRRYFSLVVPSQSLCALSNGLCSQCRPFCNGKRQINGQSNPILSWISMIPSKLIASARHHFKSQQIFPSPANRIQNQGHKVKTHCFWISWDRAIWKLSPFSTSHIESAIEIEATAFVCICWQDDIGEFASYYALLGALNLKFLAGVFHSPPTFGDIDAFHESRRHIILFSIPHRTQRHWQDMNHDISPFIHIQHAIQTLPLTATMEMNEFQQERRKTKVFFTGFDAFQVFESCLTASTPLHLIQEIWQWKANNNGQSNQHFNADFAGKRR